MAIPMQLGVVFTPAEITTMKDAATSISDLIVSKIIFNMSNEERESLSKVGDTRKPFIDRSVKDYGLAHPHLNGLAYPHTLALADADTYDHMQEVRTVIDEAIERLIELQMVAGHFAYKFMRDQYDNAAKYRSENVAGAQVVYDGLKDCFEGQGTPVNPTPPDPGHPVP